MSTSCCGHDSQFDGASDAFRRALWLVIAINAFMFLVEMPMGFIGGSEALKADSLDFLGDTFTYSISLLVIGRALIWRTRAAIFKGITLSLMGFWILASAVYHIFILQVPSAQIMGGVALAALAANLASVFILYRFRNGDANVRSVWLCSRNDAIGNIAVLGAATGVWVSNTGWPDLAVAGIMASLFLSSALSIFRQSVAEMRSLKTSTQNTDGHDHPRPHPHATIE